MYSTAVQRVAYDPATQELHVEWPSGKRSVYAGVPPDVGGGIHRQPSIGEALRAVKTNYKHRYME